MTTKFTALDVKKAALLARLILTVEELTLYQSQLHAILDFISKLQTIQLQNVQPTAQVTGLVNVYREDAIDQSRILSQADALKNAPASHNGFFKVPAILDS